MRLIDADAFKKVLDSGGGETADINISKSMPLGEIVDIVIHAYRKCLFAELEKMPTAYDVDKVTEQMQEKTDIAYKRYMDCGPGTPAVIYARCSAQYQERRECLETVKAGKKEKQANKEA